MNDNDDIFYHLGGALIEFVECEVQSWHFHDFGIESVTAFGASRRTWLVEFRDYQQCIVIQMRQPNGDCSCVRYNAILEVSPEEGVNDNGEVQPPV